MKIILTFKGDLSQYHQSFNIMAYNFLYEDNRKSDCLKEMSHIFSALSLIQQNQQSLIDLIEIKKNGDNGQQQQNQIYKNQHYQEENNISELMDVDSYNQVFNLENKFKKREQRKIYLFNLHVENYLQLGNTNQIKAMHLGFQNLQLYDHFYLSQNQENISQWLTSFTSLRQVLIQKEIGSVDEMYQCIKFFRFFYQNVKQFQQLKELKIDLGFKYHDADYINLGNKLFRILSQIPKSEKNLLIIDIALNFTGYPNIVETSQISELMQTILSKKDQVFSLKLVQKLNNLNIYFSKKDKQLSASLVQYISKENLTQPLSQLEQLIATPVLQQKIKQMKKVNLMQVTYAEQRCFNSQKQLFLLLSHSQNNCKHRAPAVQIQPQSQKNQAYNTEQTQANFNLSVEQLNQEKAQYHQLFSWNFQNGGKLLINIPQHHHPVNDFVLGKQFECLYKLAHFYFFWDNYLIFQTDQERCVVTNYILHFLYQLRVLESVKNIYDRNIIGCHVHRQLKVFMPNLDRVFLKEFLRIAKILKNLALIGFNSTDKPIIHKTVHNAYNAQKQRSGLVRQSLQLLQIFRKINIQSNERLEYNFRKEVIWDVIAEVIIAKGQKILLANELHH